jgi:hypothetical protein
MRFYDVPVNQSVPTEANRGLTSYVFVCDHLGWGGSLAALAHWLSQHGTVLPHLMSHFGR